MIEKCKYKYKCKYINREINEVDKFELNNRLI